MSVVESRQIVTRRLEFVIKGRGFSGNSAWIGDVEQAIGDARALYKVMFDDNPDTDTWLRVEWAGEELVFWFEVDEKLAQKLDARIEKMLAAGESIHVGTVEIREKG